MEESSTRSTLSDKNLKPGFAYAVPVRFHNNSGDHAGKGVDSHLGDMYQSPKNSEVSQLEVDGLLKNMKGFLRFGKLIGVIPYTGLFESSSNNLSFKPKSITAFTTYTITGILLFSCALGTIDSIQVPKRNALEIANSIRRTLYFLWGVYIYMTFIRRSQDFLNIFRAWEVTRVVYSKQDLTLGRDVRIIAVTILMSAIMENVILHFDHFKEFDVIIGKQKDISSANMTTLETYLWRSHPRWANLLGYHWCLAVLAFIQNKWILYAWNYIDILISIMGRALYFRFKCLNQVAEEILLGSKDGWLESDFKETKAYRDTKAWLQVKHDHESLCRLLQVLENFFSPIVFGSYFINVLYVALQLLDGLTTDVSRKSIVYSIYGPWSFLHLISRMFVVSICCARINVHAHETRNLLHECPPECYSKELSQIDKRLNGGPELGLTGLQTFTVTKPFILSILSVVFTFEIVFLQCIPSDAPAPNTCTAASN